MRNIQSNVYNICESPSLHNYSTQLTSRLTGLLIVIIIVVLRPFEQRRVPHPGSAGGTSLQKTEARY
jgi:hypothetical protein